jgi:hypothetical protein
MNKYFIIHRLRWPALLLLTGVIALLDQANILRWGRAWPLYLILLGVLALAERASLAAQPPVPPSDYSYGAGYPPQGYAPPAAYPQTPPPPPPAPAAPQSTGIVPAHSDVESLSKEPRKSWEEEER